MKPPSFISNFSMKNFFIKILAFTIFTSIFYVCLLFLWGSYTPALFQPNLQYLLGGYGHTFTRLKEVKETKEDIDILFLGPSHTYRGFDTRIFKKHGFNTFNLGTTSQTPIQTLTLLQRYLDHIQPKAVIYDVYPIPFMIDGVEASLDIVSNDKNDLYSLQMAVKTNNVKTYNTMLYATARDVLGTNKSFEEPIEKENEIRGDDIYIEGGYVQKEISFKDMRKITPQDIVVDKNQIKAFEQILEELDKRNIELTLVYIPISKAMYASLSNKMRYDSLMSTYAKYYNFNEIISLNDSVHFYDRHHLNQTGVDIFNDKLIEIIKSKSQNPNPKIQITNPKN